MMMDGLKRYREDRKVFINTLKNYFEIDFYSMSPKERTEWLSHYRNHKQGMYLHMREHWQDLKTDDVPRPAERKGNTKIKRKKNHYTIKLEC